MTALVWFRQDLRLADNPALWRRPPGPRGSGATAIIPVFIWAPEEEGDWPPGAASRWWLHQSLTALSTDLEKRGSRLIIRRGPSLPALEQLIAETGAEAVYWNCRYEPAAIARDRKVENALRRRGVTVETFNGSLLFEPGTILNSSGEPFRVFTAFWRATQKLNLAPPAQNAPRRLAAPRSWPESLPLAELELEPKLDWAEGLRKAWQPGERGAARQLQRFRKQALSAYATGRDRPDHVGTSRLSPHLHFGEISPGQVWRAIEGEAYLRQLIWREFAYHLLYHFPGTPNRPLRPEFAKFPWRMRRDWLSAWQRGSTGYPLVDAGMRELWHTGWMHNRVRMVVASFLVKHLLTSWQEGAVWFWDTLVDADLANNTLGWQWVAGCGADAAPYFRIFNPEIQARKFDPDGAYVRRWVKEPVPPIVDHAEARAKALLAFEQMRKSGVGLPACASEPE